MTVKITKASAVTQFRHGPEPGGIELRSGVTVLEKPENLKVTSTHDIFKA